MSSASRLPFCDPGEVWSSNAPSTGCTARPWFVFWFCRKVICGRGRTVNRLSGKTAPVRLEGGEEVRFPNRVPVLSLICFWFAMGNALLFIACILTWMNLNLNAEPGTYICNSQSLMLQMQGAVCGAGSRRHGPRYCTSTAVCL